MAGLCQLQTTRFMGHRPDMVTPQDYSKPFEGSSDNDIAKNRKMGLWRQQGHIEPPENQFFIYTEVAPLTAEK